MHMDNPDFANHFPSIGTQVAVACQPFDSIPVISNSRGGYLCFDQQWFRISTVEVSGPKVGVIHGTLRLLKHLRHVAIIGFGKGMKFAEGFIGRPLQQGVLAGSSIGTGSSTDCGKSCGNCFLTASCKSVVQYDSPG